MLKPLLLLCCAATIVSAGSDLKNDSSLLLVETTTESNADQKLNTVTLNSNVNVHATNESTEEQKPEPSQTTVILPNKPKPKPKTTTTTSTVPPTTTTPTTTTTSTSTPAPTTTTTPASTTPVPTPLPPPSTGKWIVHKNNTSCIIVAVAAQLNISYVDANNVTIQKALDIPVNGSVTGTCGKTEQNLTLSWKPQNVSTVNNSFILHFVKNETEKHYSLHHLEIFLASTEFPNDKSNKTLVHMTPLFNTGLSNSYRCFKEQILNLTLEGKNETVGQLKVSNLQFQAFRGDNSTVFGLAQDCSFSTPDIVPITVGCALAGLVVIVLIAYLVGRRRSQARGYLSM